MSFYNFNLFDIYDACVNVEKSGLSFAGRGVREYARSPMWSAGFRGVSLGVLFLTTFAQLSTCLIQLHVTMYCGQ